MFTQRHPTEPFEMNDTFEHRIRFFIGSMNKVFRIKGLESVAL